MKTMLTRILCVCLLTVLLAFVTVAQDSFEVQVYESDIVPPQHFELDIHSLFIQHGSTVWERTVAPSNEQAHLAFEFTRGITDEFELGSYLLFASRPGGMNQFAGFRLRPRIKAPDRWNLPVGLSLSTEIGFPQLQYEPNHVTLEFRPIIDRSIGRWKVALNPVLTFAFNGPEAEQGMGLEPEAMVAYEVIPDQLRMMVEYLTALGPFRHVLPGTQQVHLLYPKIEYAFSESFLINAGAGAGLTRASDALTWALRLTFNF